MPNFGTRKRKSVSHVYHKMGRKTSISTHFSRLWYSFGTRIAICGTPFFGLYPLCPFVGGFIRACPAPCSVDSYIVAIFTPALHRLAFDYPCDAVAVGDYTVLIVFD